MDLCFLTGTALLDFYEVSVEAVFLHELFVGADLVDLSVADDGDTIGEALQCRELMGYENDGAAALDAFEGLHDELDAFGINARRGFIKDEERWLAENGAGDAEALALSAGEFHASIADDRFVSLWETGDKLMSSSNDGCCLELFLRARPSKTDVVGDGVVKEANLLLDISDARSQGSERHFSQAHSVHPNVAQAWIGIAEQETDERGLSLSGLPGDPKDFACGDREIHALERPDFGRIRSFAFIAEADVVKDNVGTPSDRELLWVLWIGDRRLLLEHEIQPTNTIRLFHELIIHPAEVKQLIAIAIDKRDHKDEG